MLSRPGFFLHHSQQLPVLAQALGRSLRSEGDRDWLQAETILIPQTSLKRWLQNTLAEDSGIAANLDFQPPGRFIDCMLLPWQAKAGGKPMLDGERLRWRLLRILFDERVLARPAFAPVAAYLSGPDRQLRAWRLTGELAPLFEKYQAWRGSWLLQWSRNPPHDDWQAQLWQLASEGHNYRAHVLQAYFADLNKAHGPPPGLPAHLRIFACQNLSPDVLRVLQSFGRWSRVEFFLHNPCQAYWGDVRTAKNAEDLLALHEDNPLLNHWGFAGRDFVASLLSDQTVEWLGEDGNYPEAADDGSQTLLQRVQADILNRTPPEPTWPDAATLAQDDSIQIHQCASALREVQMLRAQLLARLSKDPGLQWRDIAIMAPDLERYAPHFSAVFGQSDDGYPALPFALSDRSLYQQAGLADLFFKLLALGNSRFTSNEGYALLSHPIVAEHYGLDLDDLAVLHDWIGQAQVRWGLDAAHRTALDGQNQQAFTWKHGLKRLLYGYASDDALVDGVAPADLPSGQQQYLLDCLCRFLDCIEQLHDALSHEASAVEWQSMLSRVLQAFCSQPERLPVLEREAYQQLNQRIAALAKLAQEAGLQAPLSLAVVASYMAEEGEAALGQAWLSGRITICKMVPMRLIPFKVIALLGLDEASFPRPEPESALDRLTGPQAKRQLGDRRIRDDDRFLMLQTLSACQGHLILSYVGTDPVTGSSKPPSLVLNELMETLGRYAPNASEAAGHVVIKHPIHGHEVALDPRIAVLGAQALTRERPQTCAPNAALGLFAPIMHAKPEAPLPGEVHIEDFIGFWQKPIERLAKQKGIRAPNHEVLLQESEPYGAAEGLAKYQLVQALWAQLLREPTLSEMALCRQLQALGHLPAGLAGLGRLRPVLDAVQQAMRALAAQRITPKPWPVDLTIGPARLHGCLQQNYAAGLITLALHKDKPRPHDLVKAGIEALLASAGHVPIATHIYTDHLLPALPRCEAQEAEQRLQLLLSYYQLGQQQLLCFDTKHSLAWLEAHNKKPHLQAQDWIAQQLAKDDEAFNYGDGEQLEFISHGAGFLQAIAAPNPALFAETAEAVCTALFGAQPGV